MNLSEDERMAGSLMNLMVKRFGEELTQKVIAEMPAQEANDVQRAIAIGKLMKGRQ